MMPQQGMEQATAYNTYMQSLPEYSQQQDLQNQIAALSAKMEADPQGTTMRNALQPNQQMPAYGGGYGRFGQQGRYGQQITYSPFNTPPAGGKGGNPTSNGPTGQY